MMGNTQNQESCDQQKQFDFIWKNLKDLKDYDQNDQALFETYLRKDQINYALGSMFGAFIGDSLGSYLQFARDVHEKHFRKAMQMPGEGTFRVKPGQFTDDSQMASHLLSALTNFNPSQNIINQQQTLSKKIAQQYTKWYYSSPFDIGITTRSALNQIAKIAAHEDKIQIKEFDKLEKVLDIIKAKNEKSQSNGSLMRITPMAFFIALLQSSDKQLQLADFQLLVKNEINMTHGNKAIFQSTQAYVELIVGFILRNLNSKTPQDILRQFESKYYPQYPLKQWIDQYKSQKQMPGNPSMGWAKIAFTYSLHYVQEIINDEKKPNGQLYKVIIQKVLKQGGDTDTNGAIVGGMIGGLIGFTNLPVEYLKKQFALRLSRKEKQCSFRGPEYEPRLQFLRAMNLIKRVKNSNIQTKPEKRLNEYIREEETK